MDSGFEWDDTKAHANLEKHGVSFEDAATVFLDPYALTVLDNQHSDDETRFIELGYSADGRLLVVICTERDARVRIISARLATGTERRQYEERRR